LAGDTTEKNYTVKEFKDTEKNKEKKSGERCMKEDETGYVEMKAYVMKKVVIPADYEKELEKCKEDNNLGDETCYFFTKIITPMKFVYNNCFTSGGRRLRNDDNCYFVSADKRRNRLLMSTEVMSKSMKFFDKKFKSMKKYQITPRVGSEAKAVFKKLRTLFKTK